MHLFILAQHGEEQEAPMPLGLPVAFLAFAQATTAAIPAETAPTPAATPAKAAQRDCSPTAPDPKSGEIVICAEKPDGYRINPDVMQARKLKKRSDAGRPTRPGPIAMKDNSCTVVGEAPCIGVPLGINLIAAAATAAEMARRLGEGKEIGSMFITDPHPTEYQLYQEAKREREAKEAEAKAKALAAKTKAAAAAAQAAQPAPENGSH